MKKIDWTEPAVKDVESIYQFISKDSEYYASSYIDEIITRIETLQRFPDMGRMVPEYGEENIKELIYQNHRIIYQVKEEKVIILTIVHSRRKLLDDNQEEN